MTCVASASVISTSSHRALRSLLAVSILMRVSCTTPLAWALAIEAIAHDGPADLSSHDLTTCWQAAASLIAEESVWNERLGVRNC